MAKSQGLNWQALIIEETQTKIKLTIRDFVLSGKSFLKLDNAIQNLINKTIRDLQFEDLKIEVKRTLNLFAEKVYKQFINDLGFDYKLLVETIKVMRAGNYTTNEIETLNKDITKMKFPYEVGLANQEYHKIYIDKVKTALNNMRQIDANAPDGTSLRNIAEMQVRYEKHQNMINNLKQNGENLVVCSTHGNCSERCEPWQGKYYTLDGTTQIVDGIKFVPLENATEIYVTTKNGKVYKNGLLGFNCRHYLIPYEKGLQIPNVSANVVEKERKIDNKMRELERNVRQWKEERDLNNGIDRQRYLFARKKAIEWNKKYIQYAKDNERAYYPDRVKII